MSVGYAVQVSSQQLLLSFGLTATSVHAGMAFVPLLPAMLTSLAAVCL